MVDEKRAFDRLVFSPEQKVKVTLKPENGENTTVIARVLNISQGGLGFAIAKNQNTTLTEEAALILQTITGDEQLHCLKGQTVKVKWILNSEIFEHIGVGCEFVELSSECFECIEKLFNGGSR
jgi:c-di-GMP-binding flagellar brake protein YcgR